MRVSGGEPTAARAKCDQSGRTTAAGCCATVRDRCVPLESRGVVATARARAMAIVVVVEVIGGRAKRREENRVRETTTTTRSTGERKKSERGRVGKEFKKKTTRLFDRERERETSAE